MSSLSLKPNSELNSLYKPKSEPNVVSNDATEKKLAPNRSESLAFLDELFRNALRLAQTQAPSKLRKAVTFDKSKVSIGIDIVCYGAYNAKMAYVLTNETNTNNIDLEVIETVEDHIGNLKYSSKYSEVEIEFVEQFQSMMRATFLCFGKRWFELSEFERKVPSAAIFKLIEIDQFPYLSFGEGRSYSMNQIVCVFFQTMLKCLRIDTCKFDMDSFKKICVTLPSDFHSYQRLALKQCFESIGLRNFILVNKSTSLTLPFLTRDLNDATKKFIIDFGSGKI
jgi:molecular chaperone DnaK (HSP70)